MSGKELPEHSQRSKPLDIESNSTVTGGTSFVDGINVDAMKVSPRDQVSREQVGGSTSSMSLLNNQRTTSLTRSASDSDAMAHIYDPSASPSSPVEGGGLGVVSPNTRVQRLE